MNNAEKIKHLRKEFKFSQKELANMVGVSQAAVYYWEKNERKPKVEQIIRLAEIFGVSLDYFDCYTITVHNEKTDSYTETYVMDCDLSKLDTDSQTILFDFNLLNELGKDEAKKRVAELTEIPRYTEGSLLKKKIT